MNFLHRNRFEILFSALLIELTYPFIALLLLMSIDTVRLVSFVYLVMASLNLATKKVPKISLVIFGGLSALALGCQSVFEHNVLLMYMKLYSTCFFYITLIYILTRNFLFAKDVNLKVVIGAISGYLLIGFLGAINVEIIDFVYPGSFSFSSPETFDYTYFSFVSLITVGYGDVVPVTSSAKSLVILLSLVGQLYMAVGIASFVGKFMNN